MLNLCLAVMVILNMIEIVWLSVPAVSEKYTHLAHTSLLVFGALFLGEYLLRVWSAGYREPEGLSSYTLRWRYISSPMGIVDLLSFLPTLLVLVLPSEAFGDLRVLKLIAIVRILKLTRYSDSLSMLARLYSDNKYTLFAAAMVMMILSFLAATGIYLFERSAQPDLFGSIPACMWWALVTLTTVGYGDMAPITVGGKLFGVLVMISGVGIAAMPAGIFASSFVQLIREQEKQRRTTLRAKRRKEKRLAEPEDSESVEMHLHFSRSEQREVDYLMSEFSISFEQAVGIVMHYRH